ncbi:hypothetical protein IAS59_000789 [Cryptococcus gattii]
MFLFDSFQLCIWEEEPVTWGEFKFLLASVVHTGYWQDPPTFRLNDIDERIERYRDVRFFKNMTPIRVLSRLQIYGGGSIPANEWDEMDKPRLTMLLSLAFPELADRVKFTLSLEDTPLPSFITEISNEEMGETRTVKVSTCRSICIP